MAIASPLGSRVVSDEESEQYTYVVTRSNYLINTME
jgi:hypothetical protein